MKKQNLARKMLDFCDGLPLAITVLGGLLSSKETVNEWETLHRDIKAYLRKGKLNEHESSLGVSWVLDLSYEELPFYLKPCFLHLAYFPEDFEIKARELCRIWMAEGFVSSEDRAYECLSELVQRCIVQVAEWGSTKRIKKCRIHDLMRDLCLSLSQEENFLHTLNPRNTHEAESSSSPRVLMPTNTVRRLAIYLNNGETDAFLSVIRRMDGRLRSLICFNPEPDISYEQLMKPLLNRFRLLRVLKFENLNHCHVVVLPEEIGGLLHLRFFSLRDSHVGKFPASIGNLRSLESLDLRVKSLYNQKRVRVSEIPPVLWKLEQLRHLYLPRNYIVGRIQRGFFRIGYFENMLKLDNLTNLETLVNVSANYYYLSGLEKLTKLTKLKVILEPDFSGRTSGFQNLRSLAIYCPYLSRALRSMGTEEEGSEAVQTEKIANFSSEEVRSLILSCRGMSKLHLYVAILQLPRARDFSPNLIKLTLIGTFLEHDPMATLEIIPTPRILVLDYQSFVGDTMVCHKKGFPRLESLSICYLDSLKEWKVEEDGAMPSLHRLVIVNCLRLKTLPEGLRHVISLKEVVIQHMLKQFKKRVEPGGEDFYKVRDVPSLEFRNTLDF